jgi:S-adenosylmethionine decarboxylase
MRSEGKQLTKKMKEKTKRSIKWIHLIKTQKVKYAGIHLIAEFWGGKIVDNSKKIEKILIEAAKKAKNTPLKVAIHKFSPQGITGVVLLAESHIAIHTWPEINYIAIDIFTCGKNSMPQAALSVLKKYFQPKRIKIIKMRRGIL